MSPNTTVGVFAAPSDNTAWRYVGGSNLDEWANVAEGESASSGITWEGNDWYSWSASGSIPYHHWRHGYEGAKAQLRVNEGVNNYYTMVPDFWGCFGDHPSLSGVINHCISDKTDRAVITTSDWCEGPLKPHLYFVPGGLDAGWYGTPFGFDQRLGTMTIGPVAEDPVSVRVGNSQCTRNGTNVYYTCPLIDSNGIFEDAEAARDWFENPEAGGQSMGHSLRWYIRYSEPFGPPGPNCGYKNWSDVGDVNLFDFQDLRTYIDEQIALSIDSDNDNIPDANDDCKNSPETYNGHNDHDGCPDELPPAECYFGNATKSCGIFFPPAPAGTVVVETDYDSQCLAYGLEANAKWVKDYTNACSNQSIQICAGFDRPPGWEVTRVNVPSIRCKDSGWAYVAQKP